jgi:HSP20 family protein
MLPDVWRRKGALAGPAFDDLMDRFFWGYPAERNTDIAWSPRTDIMENDKEITLDLELPGMKKEDIKVEIKNGMLSVSGERKQEQKFESADSTRTERYYGKYERVFSLPETIEDGKVTAEYKDGILTLTMPKSEKALPKEVKVIVK